jgi:hypothetical protein
LIEASYLMVFPELLTRQAILRHVKLSARVSSRLFVEKSLRIPAQSPILRHSAKWIVPRGYMFLRDTNLRLPGLKHWDTEDQLACLTKLFGPTSFVGNRIRQPSGIYKAKPRCTMNVLVCEELGADKLKRRTRPREFNIMTDGEICRLFICCQRHKMGDTIPSERLRSTMEYNAIQREESCTRCLINVGDLLLEGDSVHEIAEFEGRFTEFLGAIQIYLELGSYLLMSSMKSILK